MTDHNELDEKEVSAPETKGDRKSKRWLDLIADAEKAYKVYQDKSDNIDKLYADLEMLAGVSTDREFQIFWANLEVLKPTVYSRPPIPVAVPRFNSRVPLVRKAAELLERAQITEFDADDVDSTLILVRDDLLTTARGQAWVRFTEDEKVPVEHVDRKDFLHGPAREWREVEWVARRSWLNRKVGEKRFGKKVWKDVQMKERELDKNSDFKGEKKGEVWEIWHKVEKSVIWVSPGKEDVLDIKPPILSLDRFFPCPRPAYGTLQRRTLIPIPDLLFYKDQVEEINEFTARISCLSEALRVKGFYPAGTPDVGEAIEAVMKDMSNSAVLVPISNMGALGTGSLKDSIVWLPVREVAEVITILLQLRRQLIEDVYQITGLSDIMRGTTQASETLGAQKLKAQFGSIRVQSRQGEMVRFARDITRLKAEIMAEHFSGKTMLEMSQLELPAKEKINAQILSINTQMARASRNPELIEAAKANPQEAQKVLQQAKQAIQQLESIITIDAVMELLKNERLRPFFLDIETDSTIQPDEDREKQRRAEFLTAVGQFIGAAMPLIQATPEAAPFVAEALKFTAGGFRAGRQLDDAIDEFAEKMKQVASQPRPNPEAEAAKAQLQLDGQKLKIEAAKVKAEIGKLQAETQKLAQGEATGPTAVDAHSASMAERKADLAELKLSQDGQQHLDEMAQQSADRDAKLRSEQLAHDLPDGFDGFSSALGEVENEMNEAIAAMIEAQKQQNEVTAEALKMLAAAMTAPKRVVRDASGRAIGIETELRIEQ